MKVSKFIIFCFLIEKAILTNVICHRKATTSNTGLLTSNRRMVASEQIVPGIRVTGSHGNLIPNPNPNVKRRVREKVVGTVMKAAGLHRWEVFFYYNKKVQVVSSKSLKIVPAETGIPLNEETTNDNDTIVSIVLLVRICLTDNSPLLFHCEYLNRYHLVRQHRP